MDEFLDEIRAYAAAWKIKPSTVVQRAGCGGGTTWRKWASGASSPTLVTADRIRKSMADNPPPDQEEDAA